MPDTDFILKPTCSRVTSSEVSRPLFGKENVSEICGMITEVNIYISKIRLRTNNATYRVCIHAYIEKGIHLKPGQTYTIIQPHWNSFCINNFHTCCKRLLWDILFETTKLRVTLTFVIQYYCWTDCHTCISCPRKALGIVKLDEKYIKCYFLHFRFLDARASVSVCICVQPKICSEI